jgi:Domain of unknown function (DUF4388)
MAIAGRLANMSFAEVLQILDRGKKTGLLTLQVSPDGTQQHLHYIWFSQGRIVAAANRTDGAGLASIAGTAQMVRCQCSIAIRPNPQT